MAFLQPRKNRRILLVSGACLLALGLFFLIRRADFLHDAARAEGRIVAINEGRPMFTFTDQAGETHTVSSVLSSEPPAFTVGESITVLYDPRNPEDAVPDSLIYIWSTTLFCAGLGFCFILFGLIKIRLPEIPLLRKLERAANKLMIVFARMMGGIFMVFGAIPIIMGLTIFVHSAWLTMTDAHAPGRIMRNDLHQDGMYRPVYSFKNAAGHEFTVEGKVSTSWKSDWHAGDPIDVLYDPRRPEEAIIKSFTTFWLSPMLFFFGGLLFELVSWFMAFRLFPLMLRPDPDIPATRNDG